MTTWSTQVTSCSLLSYDCCFLWPVARLDLRCQPLCPRHGKLNIIVPSYHYSLVPTRKSTFFFSVCQDTSPHNNDDGPSYDFRWATVRLEVFSIILWERLHVSQRLMFQLCYLCPFLFFPSVFIPFNKPSCLPLLFLLIKATSFCKGCFT